MSVRIGTTARRVAGAVLLVALVRRVTGDDEVVELEYRPGPEGPVYARRP